METLFGIVVGAAWIAAALEAILVPTLMLRPVTLLGLGGWVLSGLWIALAVLDLWGKLPLRGPVWTGLASALAPPTWSTLAALVWSGELHLYSAEAAQPQVWSACILLALLELWVLGRNLRGRDARELLERGRSLETGLCLWPMVLGWLIFLMCTWGLLLALLIGSLIYNDMGSGWDELWGIAGLAAGWLLVHGFQVLYFWKGLYLFQQEREERTAGWMWAGMLLPAVNLFLAQRLLSRLRGEGFPLPRGPLRPGRFGQSRKKEENPAPQPEVAPKVLDGRPLRPVRWSHKDKRE